MVYIADAGPLATLPFDEKYIKALKAVHHNRCKVAFHTAKKTISSTNMLCNDKKKKSQGQTLSKVALYLKNPVFIHGQLYVVVSRCTSRSGLKVLIKNDDGSCVSETRNVVYREVLDGANAASA